MAIDTSSVPEGCTLETRKTGIIQTADTLTRAEMTEYSYYSGEGGYPVILGYDLDLYSNGEKIKTVDRPTQEEVITLAQDYVNNSVIPE
jgi:hypothetical protein